ncbi:flagellar hook assembly protein FlgD [Endothiovibrio diazotrophicus]
MIDTQTINKLGLRAQQQSTSSGGDQLGQEEFLHLLTTQMQNQDPFSPMDNGEFMGQMAQFSSVNSIQEMQKSMETLVNNLTSNESLQAATLVGSTVLAEGNVGYLPEEGEMAAAVELEGSVPGLMIGIYDDTGELVTHVELGKQSAGTVQFTWDGTANDGSVAPPGNYIIQAESHGPGVEPTAETVLVSGVVSSVSLGGDKGAVLNLDQMGSVSFSSVREIS